MGSYCIYCGAKLKEGARYCSECGAQTVSLAAPKQTAEPNEQPVSKPESNKHYKRVKDDVFALINGIAALIVPGLALCAGLYYSLFFFKTIPETNSKDFFIVYGIICVVCSIPTLILSSHCLKTTGRYKREHGSLTQMRRIARSLAIVGLILGIVCAVGGIALIVLWVIAK